MVSASFFMRAAVLLAGAVQVSASGNAIIHNSCDFDVYLWSIADKDTPMQTLKANGGEYTEAYRVNSNGGGVSIKMGVEKTCTNITQYEYTFVDGGLWYDLSNINGYPFSEYGVTVVPSDSACRSVSCPAGTRLCAAAYNIPSDNFATAECSAEADTVVVLCSYEDNTDGSASVSSIAASAAATATVAAHVSSTPVNIVAPHTVWQHISYNVPEPTTTAAPSVTAEQLIDPFVVIQTTFVTYVVTVEGRSLPTPAAVPEKRSIHGHRAAHENAAKRHSHPHAPQA